MERQGFRVWRSWRRERDTALVKAATEWRETFDAIDSPVLVLDRDGRILRLNQAATKLIGLTFQDILGRQIESVASWQPWQAMADLALKAGETRTSLSRQVSCERTKEWHVSASFAPGESQNGHRIIVMARDVTAAVRLEASLRRSEAMAALGTLVSGVAHEVRNPLFSISATVDALEVRAAGREELRPFVEALRGQLERLGRLMRDLLEYGKPAALELAEADIGQVVASAVRACEASLAEHRITILNRIEPGLARLRLDPNRVAQVVQNLVENAVQHSSLGGEIELRGAVAGNGGPPWIEISVADRGPGFPPADLPRIFEPFFTRRRGGTGLGLAIVKRFVEAHGGTTDASNRPGGGAIVTFCLPLTDTAAGVGDFRSGGEPAPGPGPGIQTRPGS